MKVTKILIIPIIIIMIGIAYYQLDRKLFYYGRNDLHIYHLLPYDVEPDYKPSFEGGFALRQEDGFSIAGKGVAYSVNNRRIWINEVLRYGFYKSELIAIIIDSNRTKYCVKFNQNRYSSEINGSMTLYDKAADSKLYKWIKLVENDDYILKLELWRNYLFFIVIGLVLILIYVLGKNKKDEAKII